MMVKRVKTVRKSAVLEHLLDLERQIRAELAKASSERDGIVSTRKSAPVRDESMSGEPGGAVAADFAQRYLH